MSQSGTPGLQEESLQGEPPGLGVGEAAVGGLPGAGAGAEAERGPRTPGWVPGTWEGPVALPAGVAGGWGGVLDPDWSPPANLNSAAKGSGRCRGCLEPVFQFASVAQTGAGCRERSQAAVALSGLGGIAALERQRCPQCRRGLARALAALLAVRGGTAFKNMAQACARASSSSHPAGYCTGKSFQNKAQN